MSLDSNFVRKFVEQNNGNQVKSQYKIDNDHAYNYIKTTFERLNVSTTHPQNDNHSLLAICQTECVSESNPLLTNIIFIRILTRNKAFIEKYFTSQIEKDEISLFGLLLHQYRLLILNNSPKNNYICEIAKIISNTIIQTKNFPLVTHYQTVMSQIQPLFLPVLKWLQYECKFDVKTTDCIYHHFRWFFLVCSHNPSAKVTFLANSDYFPFWYKRLYDFLQTYTNMCSLTSSPSRSLEAASFKGNIFEDNVNNKTSNITQEQIEFFSKVLFPCANTLFNITHSLSDHPYDMMPTSGQLSLIFYKYLTIISEIYENLSVTNHTVLFEGVVVLLCNLMSCLSCVGGVFDVFSTEVTNLLISKLNISSPSLPRKILYISGFPDTFDRYNVSKVIFLMEILQSLVICVLNSFGQSSSTNTQIPHPTFHTLTGDRNGDLIKFLVGMIALCKYSNRFRRYVRFQIIPPLKETNVRIRPEQEQSLRGYFACLLTTTDVNLNMVVGEFLYVLCRHDANRLVKYVGMGNAMGYLHHRGLLAVNARTGSTSNDTLSSDYSEIEEYETIAEQVDPITGAISNQLPTNPFTHNNHLHNEQELNSLMKDIQKLQKLDIITTANISETGKIVKSTFPNPQN